MQSPRDHFEGTVRAVGDVQTLEKHKRLLIQRNEASAAEGSAADAEALLADQEQAKKVADEVMVAQKEVDQLQRLIDKNELQKRFVKGQKAD
jgi:uncharacterized protein HemY